MSQNIVWTPASQPPAELEQHENAFYNSEVGEQLLMQGCRNCQTTAKAHFCQKLNPVSYVVWDRKNGINQTRVDSLKANAQRQTAKPYVEPVVQPEVRNSTSAIVDVPPAFAPPIEKSEPEFIDPLPEVPAFLKNIPNWIRWKLENVSGRATKVPYRVDGRKAASTRAEDWTDYRTAVTGVTIGSNGGVGFVVNGGIVGIDLDGCRNLQTGELTAWADEIINALDCYTEVTPSGTGVRVWVRGILPGGDKVFNLDPACGFGDKVKIEVYTDGRYFTVTGDSCFDPSGDVEERDLSAVYKLFHEIRAKYPAKKNPTSATVSANSEASEPGKPVQVEKLGNLSGSKYDIFMRGLVESSTPFVISDGVGRLTYPSHSEADLAFATVLAIKYQCDREKMSEDFRKSPLYAPERMEKWDRLEGKTFDKAIESAKKFLGSSLPSPSAISTERVAPSPSASEEEELIPPFDPSVVNGIYKRFVEVATRGTTLAPQFVYAIAKTIVGARMAGRVHFENLDVEPRYYTALIGSTGSGKGEAWRRVFQILNCEGQIGNVAGIKIVNSADSGAGIRDAFFEPPDTAPLLIYIDEVESFGNKAAATRNPAILDTLIELADSTQISRVKAAAKNQKANKTKNDARLCTVMCGQEGSVYMKAFAGRTKLGLWDRLYPEYSVPVESGDLPAVATGDAFQLLAELNALNYSGTMTMASDAKARLEAFWNQLAPEVRKKARWRKHFTLDVFMSAFGRGSKVAEMEDVEIAVKIFTRQLCIRQKHFTEEVPDRTGYYLSLLKNISSKMERQLAAGVHPDFVARSCRDFETETHAHRNNEGHLFDRAWAAYAPKWLKKHPITRANGQTYLKFLPETDD
jgi:putative DNA primase/helicase